MKGSLHKIICRHGNNLKHSFALQLRLGELVDPNHGAVLWEIIVNVFSNDLGEREGRSEKGAEERGGKKNTYLRKAGKVSLKLIREPLERGRVRRFVEYFLDFVDYAPSVDVVCDARLNGPQKSAEEEWSSAVSEIPVINRPVEFSSPGPRLCDMEPAEQRADLLVEALCR